MNTLKSPIPMHGPVGPKRQRYTYDEAVTRANEVLEAINSIKQQMAEARKDRASKRDFSDGDWYRSAARALSEYQVEHQELLSIAHALREKIDQPAEVLDKHPPFDIENFWRVQASIRGIRPYPPTVQECDALNFQLLRDIASIKDQIARAQYRGKATGEYASRHWFAAANNALKMKQAEHQGLLQHAGVLRREDKKQRHVASQERGQVFSRVFMQVARERMERDAYDSIIKEVHRRMPEDK